MIFGPELVRKIKAGEKTQTRRPIKPGETACRYQPGRSYALQPGRGKAAVGRITITTILEETLGQIDYRAARREGFKTTQEFRDYWIELHGHYDPTTRVWVITFETGDTTDKPRLLAARPGGPGGDYTTIPALAARHEGEAVTEAEQQRFTLQARERDHNRLNEPLRRERDQIARAIQNLEDAANSTPIRNSIRRLRRELEILNQKLAA